MTTDGGFERADRRNIGCFCITLDRPALARALDRDVGRDGFARQLGQSHPTLFSSVATFVPASTLARMKRIVAAVEAAAQLPGYRSAALSWASPIAERDFGPAGVFMGYDFHLSVDGPKLIEVNTNAGGAFLNAALARAQRVCCAEAEALPEPDTAESFGAKVSQMFGAEWRRQGRAGRPRTLAIVDDAPEQQHLYPEFQLAKALLEKSGVQTFIADPGQLALDGERLTLGGRPVDLVYNRLVDFAFEAPGHAALRTAYAAGGVVVTPNPHVHALLADKRNLSLLSDLHLVARWGLDPGHLDALRHGLPTTVVVGASNAEDLWARRRELFFKPAAGYGSRAAYRGDKLTRKVWEQVRNGSYVAQAYAPPSRRAVTIDGQRTELKVDVRLYTYAGSSLLAAARLYQGQTTNMRTPGGGFAPLLLVDDAAPAA